MLQRVFTADLDPARLPAAVGPGEELSARVGGDGPGGGGTVMRIGIACPYSWDVPGGVQQHIRDLAEALIDAGPRRVGDLPGRRRHAAAALRDRAGRAVPVPYNGSVARLSFGFLSVSRVRRWIKDGDFDVLHVHEPEIPSLSLLACWVAYGPDRGDVPHRDPALARAAGHLPGGAHRRWRRSTAGSPCPRRPAPRWSSTSAATPCSSRTAWPPRRYRKADPLPGWPGPGGAIGFLGRMDEPRKGLSVLLKAFEILGSERPGLRLLIAGRADDRARCCDRVPAELRDRVVLLGQVSEEDKVRRLHSVDVFCSPNTGGESFGIVTAEAMAAGVPIVASDIEAFRQVLRGGEAGELSLVPCPFGGTGSVPPGCHGPQRRIRLTASQEPLSEPCTSIASRA